MMTSHKDNTKEPISLLVRGIAIVLLLAIVSFIAYAALAPRTPPPIDPKAGTVEDLPQRPNTP